MVSVLFQSGLSILPRFGLWSYSNAYLGRLSQMQTNLQASAFSCFSRHVSLLWYSTMKKCSHPVKEEYAFILPRYILKYNTYSYSTLINCPISIQLAQIICKFNVYSNEWSKFSVQLQESNKPYNDLQCVSLILPWGEKDCNHHMCLLIWIRELTEITEDCRC